MSPYKYMNIRPSEIALRGGLPLHNGNFEETIRRLRAEVGNFITNPPMASDDWVPTYVELCNKISDGLQGSMRPADVDALVFSSSYHRLVSLEGARIEHDASKPARRLYKDLENIIGAVQFERGRWAEVGAVLVPDANVFMHAIPDVELRALNWTALTGVAPAATDDMPDPMLTVVILNVVIEELDRLKDRGHDKARGIASRALRQLNQLLPGDELEVTVSDSLAIRVEMDDLTNEPLISTDREILAQSLEAQRRVPDERVTLLTRDTSMAFRARREGLAVAMLKDAPKKPGRQRKKDAPEE